MNNEISPRRRKIVILCSSLASFSACAAALSHNHPKIATVIAGTVFIVMIYAAVEFFRLKREEERA